MEIEKCGDCPMDDDERGICNLPPYSTAFEECPLPDKDDSTPLVIRGDIRCGELDEINVFDVDSDGGKYPYSLQDVLSDLYFERPRPRVDVTVKRSDVE